MTISSISSASKLLQQCIDMLQTNELRSVYKPILDSLNGKIYFYMCFLSIFIIVMCIMILANIAVLLKIMQHKNMSII